MNSGQILDAGAEYSFLYKKNCLNYLVNYIVWKFASLLAAKSVRSCFLVLLNAFE